MRQRLSQGCLTHARKIVEDDEELEKELEELEDLKELEDLEELENEGR